MLGHDAVGLKAQWLGDMFVQELAKSLADDGTCTCMQEVWGSHEGKISGSLYQLTNGNVTGR